MTDLPDNANKLVAEACGFEWDLYPLDIKKITVDEWVLGVDPFEPATDRDAAGVALEAWAIKNRVLVTLRCSGMLNGVWTCCAGKEPDTIPIYENECEAICTMILEAEKARKE